MSKLRLIRLCLPLALFVLGIGAARLEGADCTCPLYSTMRMQQGTQFVYVYYGIRYGSTCSNATPVAIYSSSGTLAPGSCSNPNCTNCQANTTVKALDKSKHDHVPWSDVESLKKKVDWKTDKPDAVISTEFTVTPVTDFFFQFVRPGETSAKWAHGFVHKIKTKTAGAPVLYTAVAFECTEPDDTVAEIIGRDLSEQAEEVVAKKSYAVNAGPYRFTVITRE